MSRFIVGLDISYTNTGVAVLKDGVYQPDWSFTFPTNVKQGSHVARADLIAKKILKHLDAISSQGEVFVFVEDYAFARLVNREAMGELGGIVKHSLWERNYPWETLPISTIRKIVTGKGNAKKDQVMYSLLKRHDIDINQNDLADAAAVALTGDYVIKARELAGDYSSFMNDVRDALKSYLKANPVGV